MTANYWRTMGIRCGPINLFFLWVLMGALGFGGSALAADPATAGTGTTGGAGATGTPPPAAPKKESKPKKASDRLAIIRFHMETTDDGGPKAEVIRSQPQVIPIEKMPFFDERDVASAELVETPDGGFIIQIDGTQHGRNALEMATIAGNGRRLAIYGQWTTDDNIAEIRWLAAPKIRAPFRNGVVRFSADCDRTEAQMLVDGLNNVAVKLKNRPKNKGDSNVKAKDATKKSPVNSTSAAGDLINRNTRP